MSSKTNIAIRVAGQEAAGAYFSLRLKTGLKEENAIYYDAPKALVISNIQGRFKELQFALRQGGIIDEKGKWIFDNGHLVIFGDPLNIEGAQECLWYIYGLEARAFKKGGTIHYIVSGQELTMLSGSWPSAQPNYAFTAGGKKSFAFLYDGNNELRRWLLTKNMLEKIGRFLFLNGEVSPEMVVAGLPLNYLNKKIRASHIKRHPSPGNPSMPDDLLLSLIRRYGAARIITAVNESTPVVSRHKGAHINISSVLQDDYAESLMLVRTHLLRFNTRGEKEKLQYSD